MGGREGATFSSAAAGCPASPHPLQVYQALAWAQELHVMVCSQLPQQGACCSCSPPPHAHIWNELLRVSAVERSLHGMSGPLQFPTPPPAQPRYKPPPWAAPM